LKHHPLIVPGKEKFLKQSSLRAAAMSRSRPTQELWRAGREPRGREKRRK
jgi:hypothetical protein